MADKGKAGQTPPTVLVCVNRRLGGSPSCGGRGGEAVARALEKTLEEEGIPARLEREICFGHCEKGPNVKIVGGRFFHGVTPGGLGPVIDVLKNRLTRVNTPS